MSSLTSQLLNLAIFLPLLFAAMVALLPAAEVKQIRLVTTAGMVATFALTLWIYARFVPQGPEIQFEHRSAWIDAIGVSFHTGVDGLSASLILLTGFLGPWVVLASKGQITSRVKEFHLALLLLQTAMIGTLASLDLVLFYVFWESMLIPMYLLIGVWGAEERQMAATKFFLYTLAGSLLMLVAILGLHFVVQPRTFDYPQIYNALIDKNQELAACAMGPCAQLSPIAQVLKTFGPWMFLAFALAFAIKVPMFPVHTWLPDAHVQAPTAGSIILAGVMLKMGTFGFWRFAIPLFPHAVGLFRPALAALAVVGIVYGALMCLAQRDVKKLIAYSSVSHLGYCMLGMLALTVEGASGSAYQMLNHGVSTGALFLLFGMLYQRRHTRLIADYGGIARAMPLFAAFFLVATFSSVAVPGTNGFVGELLVLLGTFQSSLPAWLGPLGALGIILGAAYMLWMVQRVFFGDLSRRENAELADLGLREISTALPFLGLALAMGLYPQPFLDRLEPSAKRLVQRSHLSVPGYPLDRSLVPIQAMPLLPAGSNSYAWSQPK